MLKMFEQLQKAGYCKITDDNETKQMFRNLHRFDLEEPHLVVSHIQKRIWQMSPLYDFLSVSKIKK